MVTETLRPTFQHFLIHFCANASRANVLTVPGEFCDSLGCPEGKGQIVLAVDIVARLLTPGQRAQSKPTGRLTSYQSLSGEAQDVDVLGNQFPSICVIIHNLGLPPRLIGYVSDCRFSQLEMANLALS